MRDIVWRMGVTLVVLTILATMGLSASCQPAYHLLEQALGRTPQAQIAAFLAVTSEGDRQAALALWTPPTAADVTLAARRESVTDDLLSYGPSLEYRVLAVEWWRSCCEPAVISDPNEAGAARVRVAIWGEGRPKEAYLFDLLVPGGTWGTAASYPLREWAIVDIYAENAAPLAWTLR
jgi:hypothetical protein